MKTYVDFFNDVAGNHPAGVDDPELFWEQVGNQASLLGEETTEVIDAAQNRDIVELVDGIADVEYVLTWLKTLVAAAGVDISKAKEIVCHNNDSKITTSFELAVESMGIYPEGVVELFATEIGGINYYTIRRTIDGKIMKLMGHNRPDFTEAIPKSTIEALS